MEKKKEYYDIFACARNFLADDIENAVKLFIYNKSIEHNVSIAYLLIVANNLTAYNELYPYPRFVSTSFFRK